MPTSDLVLVVAVLSVGLLWPFLQFANWLGWKVLELTEPEVRQFIQAEADMRRQIRDGRREVLRAMRGWK